MRKSLLALVVALGVCLVALTAASPAQAQASISFRAQGISAEGFFLDGSNPTVVVYVNLIPSSAGTTPTASNYFMTCDISDLHTFTDAGAGFIPLSAVNITGSLESGNALVRLNVNTCDVVDFMTFSGQCGSL